MRTYMFYSYKGGSGRTVAAANVAVALAKQGRRVAIVDLDFEAPGLQYVFRVDGSDRYLQGEGIQHYLRGDLSVEELFKGGVFDLFDQEGPLRFYKVPEPGGLLYLMASGRVVQIDAQDPKVEQRMRELLAHLREEKGIEFLILDAASGIRDAYAIAAEVTDEMLMFFRWSRQHVEGTVQMVRFLHQVRKFSERSFPCKLVASASPERSDLDGIADSLLRDRLIELRERTTERINAALREADMEPGEIFHDIPEMRDLKWSEGVRVLDDADSPFEALAVKLIKVYGEDVEGCT
jgi:MinD-like ATPase involved in chromosome partitioning or flagellar assembly